VAIKWLQMQQCTPMADESDVNEAGQAELARREEQAKETEAAPAEETPHRSSKAAAKDADKKES
jgi:hypothetical protein